MHDACSNCQASFQREAGFFLGSIYVNYGLTALMVSIAYPALLFGGVLSDTWLMGMSLAFVVVFPIAFFPFARSLWLGFDEFFDPRSAEGEEKE